MQRTNAYLTRVGVPGFDSPGGPMGVPTQEDCEGEAPFALLCTSCDTEYWTDETMMNDCPECGSHYDWEPRQVDQ